MDLSQGFHLLDINRKNCFCFIFLDLFVDLLIMGFYRRIKNMQEKNKKEIKSAYDMTDEEVAKSVDLETSDFSDDGSDLDELRDIMEGNV